MVKEPLRARLIAGRARFHRHADNSCHAPRRRGIQYAAASRSPLSRRTGSPGRTGRWQRVRGNNIAW